MKICTQCKQNKTLSSFYSRKDSTKYQNKCKQCMDSNFKEYYNKNKSKILTQQQTESKFKRRDQELKRRYGISLDEYNLLLEGQNKQCAICKINISSSSHLDHCHKTKKVRGILCQHCNQGLGQFKDNHLLLQKAIDYLKTNQV